MKCLFEYKAPESKTSKRLHEVGKQVTDFIVSCVEDQIRAALQRRGLSPKEFAQRGLIRQGPRPTVSIYSFEDEDILMVEKLIEHKDGILTYGIKFETYE